MTVKVKMSFNQSTIDSVDDLCKITGEQNKTQITANAIKLYRELWGLQLNNTKIYTEDQNGERDCLILI